MPLPFDFEGKGVLDFAVTDITFPAVSPNFSGKSCLFRSSSFGEPTSVLDSIIPNGPTSSSTLSSSLGSGGGGGGASTDRTSVAAVSGRNPSPKWQQDSTTATSSSGGGADTDLVPVPSSLVSSGGGNGENTEKCAMEEEQYIFRWIMGDVEDGAMGSLNKVLQIGGGGSGGPAASEFEFSGGFGVVDQAFVGDYIGANSIPNFSNNNRSTAEKTDFASSIMYPSPISNNLASITAHHPPAFESPPEMKPSIFNPQFLINQNQSQQAQNPSFFLPFSNTRQQEHTLPVPLPAKRLNSGGPVGPARQEMFFGRQQLNHQQHLLPHYLHQRQIGPGPKMGCGDEWQQAIVEQLYMAAELLQTGNQVLAQGILARLNHQLSPIGNPFVRAAFYCKEALQLLLHPNNSHSATSLFSLIFKIGAYKSFSEISPLIEFTNFTCNQALLEVLEGFDQIHIVDFDIGYGGQWASLIQELALRNGGALLLKITALASPTTHDPLELSLTRENLIQFANEVNIGLEFDVISTDCLNSGTWSLPLHVLENEAIAVNLPIGYLTNYQLPLPMVLRFIKQLSPRIVVSIDRGCDRTDLPFANHIIHALQSYSNLLESLDAVNVNVDALQKIERFLIQSEIERIVTGRFRALGKSEHWRSLFLSSGFSPLTFSNFTESQAECVVKRTPIRGFQVEKRQSSLILCWQRKELVSVSVWRCGGL